MLVLGTIPAALVGGLLEDQIASVFGRPALVAVLLLVTALLLVFSERHYTADRSLSDLSARDALFVGAAQALAILPGISRSGSTIAAGILRGTPRAVAARFSFLLAAPIIFGAGIKQALDLLLTDENLAEGMESAMAVGFISAAVVGFLCIWFLMRLLQRQRLYGFAVYCAVFGTLSLLVALFS